MEETVKLRAHENSKKFVKYSRETSEGMTLPHTPVSS
jgi:hypothetical protein